MSASDATLGGLPIAAGDILLKKYRVERLIGQGGTGIVLSATHVQLEQRVAIKFLRRALASDELRTRFEREARAMGKIESDHVVLVLDAGALDDGAPYMVMEYLDGRDLARVLEEDGPLPVEEVVDCMLQVCEALQQAHAAGIVHRDLKPANLFLTRREDDDAVHVKVVDFGISKILDKKLIDDESPHEVTTAFTMLGSPRYMAPEQVRSSKDVDGRADLWSVGAVLFQLMTGEHAFAAEGNVQASLAVLTADPRRLRALAPHAPPGLEDVVSRCLTRDVDARIQSASELAEALRPFASDRARDSLDRLESAKAVSCLPIALSAASTSMPPRALEPVVVMTGSREAPTERRIRIGDGPVVMAEPRRAPPEARPPASSRAPFVLAIVGVSALAVVGVAVAAFRAVAASAPRAAASVAATAPASASVLLDAGKASP
ncbi:MAG: serine/threonine protein kinase [Labilithrix sp.]|nr:serine/threonine protein kinase [Labilithrix sp.]